MDEAEKLELEQLEHVSGGRSQGEETSRGFRKTCPLCDTFSWCTKTGNYRDGSYFFDEAEYMCGSCGGTFWK